MSRETFHLFLNTCSTILVLVLVATLLWMAWGIIRTFYYYPKVRLKARLYCITMDHCDYDPEWTSWCTCKELLTYCHQSGLWIDSVTMYDILNTLEEKKLLELSWGISPFGKVRCMRWRKGTV